jgi:hypothetical protein
MSEMRMPDLLEIVRHDLRPVRPMAPPARRVLAVIPIGAALLVGMPLYWGVRENIGALGSMASWGLSALEAIGGVMIVGAALREAVPGRTLARSGLAFIVAAGVMLAIGTSLMTARLLPTTMPSGVWLRFAWECMGMAMVWGIPALALPAWLAVRLWPERPAVAGGLYGLGIGIMCDAGVRLFCWVSSPSHVILAHGGALAAIALCGAGAATVLDRMRHSRARR